MRHVGKVLLWGVLVLMALVGVVALVVLGGFHVEHLRHCSPPQPDSRWVRDCDMNVEVTAMVFVYGVPWLFPLMIAGILRGVRRSKT